MPRWRAELAELDALAVNAAGRRLSKHARRHGAAPARLRNAPTRFSILVSLRMSSSSPASKKVSRRGRDSPPSGFASRRRPSVLRVSEAVYQRPHTPADPEQQRSLGKQWNTSVRAVRAGAGQRSAAVRASSTPRPTALPQHSPTPVADEEAMSPG